MRKQLNITTWQGSISTISTADVNCQNAITKGTYLHRATSRLLTASLFKPVKRLNHLLFKELVTPNTQYEHDDSRQGCLFPPQFPQTCNMQHMSLPLIFRHNMLSIIRSSKQMFCGLQYATHISYTVLNHACSTCRMSNKNQHRATGAWGAWGDLAPGSGDQLCKTDMALKPLC